MYFGKKFKAFSMVELMMVLLISALIIAAIVPIITRKHMQLPTLASHGAYFCYYGPRSFTEDPITHEVTDVTDATKVLREARWSGTDYARKVYDRETANCVFEPPKKAPFFLISAVGGGGGGSDSGYRGSLPTQDFTTPTSVSPFNQTEDTLKALDIDKDVFKEYSGYVVAYAQAKKSGAGGNMGWYHYTDTNSFDTPCLAHYGKVACQEDRTWNNPHHDWGGGTPTLIGYYTYSDGTKFVVSMTDPIYDTYSCCNYAYYNSTGDKEGSDCFYCHDVTGDCVSGSTPGWVSCSPKQYQNAGTTVKNITGLPGGKCQVCTGAVYYDLCDSGGTSCTPVYQATDPCKSAEGCGTKYSVGPKVDPDKNCSQRTIAELQGYISGYSFSDGGVNSGDDYVSSIDANQCKYTVQHKTEKTCWKDCEREADTRQCDQLYTPIDKTCSSSTGKHERKCYKLSDDGTKAEEEIECPSCVGETYEDAVTCGWTAPVGGTSDHWIAGEEDKTLDGLCCKSASGNVWIGEAEYTNSDGEPMFNNSVALAHECDCETYGTPIKLIDYDPRVNNGQPGADGARCNTDFVKVDVNLKYNDASNPNISDGSYRYAYPLNLSNPAVYNAYYNAEKDGTKGADKHIYYSHVSELNPWGWEEGAEGTYYADAGTSWCWNGTTFTATEGTTTCSEPTFSRVEMDKAGTKIGVKAFSASKGGAAAGRVLYTDSWDNEVPPNPIKDSDGNLMTLRLNKEATAGTAGIAGTCDTAWPNQNVPGLNKLGKGYTDLWNTVGGDYETTYKTDPYGYVLLHSDGTLEKAGNYITYKSFDTIVTATGSPGQPGSGFTNIFKFISPENRAITVGVGGSAAALGTGADGTAGSPTSMGSLFTVEGGDGGTGSNEVYYDYPMLKVYDAVEYVTEDLCYFHFRLKDLPAGSEYMGRKKNDYASVPAGVCDGYIDGTTPYKWHIKDGGGFGGTPAFSGGTPEFGDKGVAQRAFEKGGQGGQAGGVEHFCLASQKIIIFEGHIDYKNSVFREDAFVPGTPEYESLYGASASPKFDLPTAAELTLLNSNIKAIPGGGTKNAHIIPRACYSDTSELAYNHIAAGPGKDGYVLIRW